MRMLPEPYRPGYEDKLEPALISDASSLSQVYKSLRTHRSLCAIKALDLPAGSRDESDHLLQHS